VAYQSLATGSKQTTKQLEGGFVEPGQELTTQPNRPLIYGKIYMVGSNAAVINLFVSLDNCHVRNEFYVNHYRQKIDVVGFA